MTNDKKINEDDLKVLHLVHNNPKISQRGIAQKMGFSLGKVNYCIKALTEVGFIKCKTFLNHKNKAGYLYLLTPKGVSEKTALTKRFLENNIRKSFNLNGLPIKIIYKKFALTFS